MSGLADLMSRLGETGGDRPAGVLSPELRALLEEDISRRRLTRGPALLTFDIDRVSHVRAPTERLAWLSPAQREKAGPGPGLAGGGRVAAGRRGMDDGG